MFLNTDAAESYYIDDCPRCPHGPHGVTIRNLRMFNIGFVIFILVKVIIHLSYAFDLSQLFSNLSFFVQREKRGFVS